ncbi:DUF5665 domain-containing protein [Cognatishimia sp. SS12]|uniref:DUF5665 domain-containing protein n=1 Tax=Cognatishimia sp. SS12 TaxID=2979465 RepID=UPI00232EFCE4|nr:DUF5665 domain-containing protein [Cognatishimia sp. SS12]MDC0737954.1 DUF5665 domain-containing protein [Cognatishimia sp. SS12]
MSHSPDSDAPTTEALDRLTREVELLNSHRFIRLQNSFWRMVGFQFVRGLAFGLGSVIGATILVSVFAWWIAQLEFIPIIGDWAAQILEEMNPTD